ncbi:MAG TPA: DUF1844 domain-containing protein [Candidatus Cryosericum sp.]|nr:DUF1844 domain-containing protein [Candidatus Cryosericum sp.]
MTESEQNAGKRHEPLRVIDRRTFTPEGERRQPDAAREESPHHQAPPAAPESPLPAGRGTPPATGEADPVASAHFQNLIVNLARQAVASLGATQHPLTGQVEVDMEAAQQMIALLQSLRQKTRGNLTLEETDLLEGLIGDLQMQYVAVRSKAKTRP